MNPGILLANVSEIVAKRLFALSTKHLNDRWELELHYLDREQADDVIDVLEDPINSACGVHHVEAVYIRARSNYYLVVRFNSLADAKMMHNYLIDIMDSTGA